MRVYVWDPKQLEFAKSLLKPFDPKCVVSNKYLNTYYKAFYGSKESKKYLE